MKLTLTTLKDRAIIGIKDNAVIKHIATEAYVAGIIKEDSKDEILYTMNTKEKDELFLFTFAIKQDASTKNVRDFNWQNYKPNNIFDLKEVLEELFIGIVIVDYAIFKGMDEEQFDLWSRLQ